MRLAAVAAQPDLVTRGLWRAAASKLPSSPAPSDASAVGKAAVRALEGAAASAVRAAVEQVGYDDVGAATSGGGGGGGAGGGRWGGGLLETPTLAAAVHVLTAELPRDSAAAALAAAATKNDRTTNAEAAGVVGAAASVAAPSLLREMLQRLAAVADVTALVRFQGAVTASHQHNSELLVEKSLDGLNDGQVKLLVDLVMAHVGEAELATAARELSLTLTPVAAVDALLGASADRRDVSQLVQRLQFALAELTSDEARNALAAMVPSMNREATSALVGGLDHADVATWRDVHAALEEAKSATSEEWLKWQEEIRVDLATALQYEETSVTSLKAAVAAVAAASTEVGAAAGAQWERIVRTTLARLSPTQLHGLMERTLDSATPFTLRRVCIALSRVSTRQQLASLLQPFAAAVTAAALRGYVAMVREGLTPNKAAALAELWDGLDADCRQVTFLFPKTSPLRQGAGLGSGLLVRLHVQRVEVRAKAKVRDRVRVRVGGGGRAF